MIDILQFIRRWQDPGIWKIVRKLERYAEHLELESRRFGEDARLLSDRGDIQQSRELRSEAKHLRQCADGVRKQRSKLVDELLRIETWVRQHHPALLKFVPTAQFEGDPRKSIKDLKRLEGRIPPSAGIEEDHPEILKATAKEAAAFRDGGKWCTADYAKRRFGISPQQLNRASTQTKGLGGIVVSRRKAQVSDERRGQVFVYHAGDLQWLADHLDREE